MCTQCLVNPFYYGEIAPGWFLIRARRNEDDEEGMKIGEWGLVESNNPSIVFKTTPFVYADKHKLDIVIEKFSDELYTDVHTGYRLYEALNKVKIPISAKRLMVKHNCLSFENKFYIYLADYIEKSNPAKNIDPFPNLDDLIEHDYEMNPKTPYREEVTGL